MSDRQKWLQMKTETTHMTKHTQTEGRGREWKQILDTCFGHAHTVCRSARAQRPELKLRNPDRQSQLHPMYTIFFNQFGLFFNIFHLSLYIHNAPVHCVTYSLPKFQSCPSPPYSSHAQTICSSRTFVLCCLGHLYSWVDTQQHKHANSYILNLMTAG